MTVLCKEIFVSFNFSYDALQYLNFHHTKITRYTVVNRFMIISCGSGDYTICLNCLESRPLLLWLQFRERVWSRPHTQSDIPQRRSKGAKEPPFALNVRIAIHSHLQITVMFHQGRIQRRGHATHPILRITELSIDLNCPHKNSHA